MKKAASGKAGRRTVPTTKTTAAMHRGTPGIRREAMRAMMEDEITVMREIFAETVMEADRAVILMEEAINRRAATPDGALLRWTA